MAKWWDPESENDRSFHQATVVQEEENRPRKRSSGRGLPSLSDLGKSVAGGITGTAESMLEGAGWASEKIGKMLGLDTEGITESAREAAAAVKSFREENFTPEQEHILNDIAAGVGSMITFLLPGTLVSRAPLLLAQTANVSRAVMAWASAAGIASSSALEAMAEAGSVFREAVDSGMDPEEASDAATRTFFKNMALLGVTNKLSGFFEVGRQSLKKAALRGFFFEGAQEAGQSMISQHEVSGDIDIKQAAYEGLIGGIVGGGAGGVLNLLDKKIEAKKDKGGDSTGVVVDSEVFGSGMTPNQLREHEERRTLQDRVSQYAKWAQEEIERETAAELEAKEKQYLEELKKRDEQNLILQAKNEQERDRIFVDSISTREGLLKTTADIIPELVESNNAEEKRIGKVFRDAHRALWMGDWTPRALKERLYELEEIERKVAGDKYMAALAFRLKEEVAQAHDLALEWENRMAQVKLRKEQAKRASEQERAKQAQRVERAAEEEEVLGSVTPDDRLLGLKKQLEPWRRESLARGAETAKAAGELAEESRRKTTEEISRPPLQEPGQRQEDLYASLQGWRQEKDTRMKDLARRVREQLDKARSKQAQALGMPPAKKVAVAAPPEATMAHQPQAKPGPAVSQEEGLKTEPVAPEPRVQQPAAAETKPPKAEPTSSTQEQQKILEAYRQLKDETGFSHVEIATLADRAGVPLEKVKDYIRANTKSGHAILGQGDWSLSSPRVREGAVDLLGKKHTLVAFDEAVAPAPVTAPPAKESAPAGRREALRAKYGDILDRVYANQESARRAIRKRKDKGISPETHTTVQVEGGWKIVKKPEAEHGRAKYSRGQESQAQKPFGGSRYLELKKRAHEKLGEKELRSWVESVRDIIHEGSRRIKLPARITVVDKADTLPGHLRDQIKKDNAEGDVEGIFDPKSNRIYIVARNIQDLRHALRVMLHELGHYSIRDLGGENIIEAVAKKYANLIDQRLEAFGYAKTRENILREAEEILVDMYLDKKLDSKFVLALKRFIRKLAASIGLASNEVTDADIDAFVMRMRENLTRRRPETKTGTGVRKIRETDIPSYSRASDKAVPKTKHDEVAQAIKLLNERAKRATKTVVVRSVDQIPESIRPQTVGEGNVYSAFDKDKETLYLVSQDFTDANHAARVWMQHQVGRHGLFKFLESVEVDVDKFIDGLYPLISKTNEYKKLVEDRRIEVMGLSESEKRRKLAEEFLAVRAGKLSLTKRNLIWSRIRDLINRFFRSINTPFRIQSLDEVDLILEGAKKWVLGEGLREFTEFQYSDEQYKEWIREIVTKHPEALSWYDNHQRLVESVFMADSPIFNAILGLTSKGAGVRTNAQWAIDTYLFLNGIPGSKPGGKYPKITLERFKKAFGDNSGFLQNITKSSGSSFKVSEFIRALLGDKLATVNDRWMYRIFFGDHMLNKRAAESQEAFEELQSKFSLPENYSARHKMFQLAKEMSEELGKPISPREVQAALWMYYSAKESGITVEEQWDYHKALTSPATPSFLQKYGLDPKKHKDTSPIDVLRMKMAEAGKEIGQLHKEANIGKIEEVSDLEKAYTNYLERKGVKKIDLPKYSRRHPDMGMGVHYRGVSLKEGEFLRASGVKDNRDYSVFSRSDIGNRVLAHTERNPYQPVVYFYEAGTPPERQLRMKPNRYNVDLDKYNIYDATKDELNILREVAEEQKRDPGASETNILIRLVKERGFDGILINNPYRGPGRWVLLAKQEVPIDYAPTKVDVGISDVVEGLESLPQDIKALEKILGKRSSDFFKRIQKTLDKYTPEVILEGYNPAIAHFPVATSDLTEIGGLLKLRGPLPAVRAAAAILGLSNLQRQVYVMHDQGKPNGRFFRIKVRPEYKTISEVAEKLKAEGLREFNITVNPLYGSIMVEQFVPASDEYTNHEVIDKLSKLVDIIADPKFPFDHATRVNSEVLGDQEWEVTDKDASRARSIENYKKHILDYFGKTKGEEIYGESIKEREAHAGRVSGRTGQDARKQRDQGRRPPEGLDDGLDPRYSRKREGPIAPVFPVTKNPAFRKWFGKSVVRDRFGNPRVVYHGTTHDFTVFDTKEGYRGGYLGAGSYFTDSVVDVRNYAGFGPDLRFRIEEEKSSIINDGSDDEHNRVIMRYILAHPELGEDPDVIENMLNDEGLRLMVTERYLEPAANEAATKKIAGPHQGAVYPVYLKIERPFYTDNKKTFIDKNSTAGKQLSNVVENVLFTYGLSPEAVDSTISSIEMRMMDNGGIYGEELFGILDQIPDFAVWDNSFVSSGQYLQEIARELGYDGLIMDAGERLGRMSGIQGAMHYMPFEPEQIKSAIGNRGTFDPKNPDILYSRPTPQQQEILNHIGIGKVHNTMGGGRSLEMSLWDKFVTQALDSLHPIQVLEKAVEGQPLEVVKSGYKSYRLLNSFPNIFKSILYDGLPKFENGWIVVQPDKMGGLFSVIQRLGSDAEGFFRWMTAKSAEEMLAKGRKHLFGKNKNTGEYLDDAQVIQTLYDVTQEQYDRNKGAWDSARERLRQINKSVLDFAERSGLISAEDRAVWERMDYIPFYRVLEDDWTAGNPEENIKALFPKSGVPHIGKIHKLEGSSMNMGDPMMNLVNSYSFLLHESLKNIARTKTLRLADQAGMLKKTFPREGKGVISIRINGKASYYKVSDPWLYDALVDMEAMTQGKLSDAMKALGLFKKTLTAGVTIAPAFRIANFIRDTLQTAAFQKSFVPFMDSWRGLIHAWRRSDQFKEFASTGGAFGGSYHERDVLARDQKELEKLKKELAGKNGGIFAGVKKLWDMWEKIGTTSENAARMGAYLRGLENGMSKADAAFFARDLLDFHQHGKSGIVLFMIRTIPFMNARIQGLYRLGRGAVDPQNRNKFFLMATVMTLASAALHAYNKDDDWYDELPKNERMSYWHIPIPGGRLRIPIPFEFGSLFGVMPTALMSYSEGTWDNEELGDFIRTLAGENLKLLDWPQFIKPIVAQIANQDLYTGAPIIPKGEEQLEGPLQYGPRTSKIARELAKFMPEGLDSPRRIDKLTDDLFGTVAFAVRDAADMILANIASYPEDPASRIGDYPIIGRFIREEGEPARYTRYQDAFYRMLQEADMALATAREYRKLGEVDKLREYVAENRDRIVQGKYLNNLQKQVGIINQKMKLVHRNKSMSPEEKREALDRLLEQRNKLFETGVQVAKRLAA